MEYAILGALSSGIYICWRRLTFLEREMRELRRFLDHPYTEHDGPPPTVM